MRRLPNYTDARIHGQGICYALPEQWMIINNNDCYFIHEFLPVVFEYSTGTLFHVDFTPSTITNCAFS
jgi:hypothetical protein